VNGKNALVDQLDNSDVEICMFNTVQYKVSVSVSEQSVSPDKSRACTPSQRFRRESGDRYFREVLCRGELLFSWVVSEDRVDTSKVAGQGGSDPCFVRATGLVGSSVATVLDGSVNVEVSPAGEADVKMEVIRAGREV